MSLKPILKRKINSRDENDMETKFRLISFLFVIKGSIETVITVWISSVDHKIVSYQFYFPDFYHCTVIMEMQGFKGKKT